MDNHDRDEAAIDLYFSELGDNQRITSYDIFKARIGFEITEGQSFTKIIEHLWQASRSASLISSINRFAGHETSKAANKFISRKLNAVYDRFLSGDNVVTSDDLERIMGLHVRLQTVPTSRVMAYWTKQTLSRMDDVPDEWYASNFDHFTKLGIYPHDEFIKLWWTRTEARIKAFAPVNQFRILYKMAQFDFLRTHDFGDLYAGIASPCRDIADKIFNIIEPQAGSLFPELINNQVFFAGLWFEKDFVRESRIAGDDGAQASAFENLVAESIRKTSIGVNYDGMRVPVTGHKIDLKLGHGGKFYGCEVDGISHFNRIVGASPSENAVIYNSSTRFHSWLTAQYLTDINIIRIPYFLFDADATGIPWEKTLSRIARKEGHSIYVWHGGSIVRDMQAEKNAHIFKGHDL